MCYDEGKDKFVVASERFTVGKFPTSKKMKRTVGKETIYFILQIVAVHMNQFKYEEYVGRSSG